MTNSLLRLEKKNNCKNDAGQYALISRKAPIVIDSYPNEEKKMALFGLPESNKTRAIRGIYGTYKTSLDSKDVGRPLHFLVTISSYNPMDGPSQMGACFAGIRIQTS